MRKLVVVAAGLALALPAPAAAGRFALGVERGFSAERVADRVEAATGRPVTVIGPFAVAVDVPNAQGLATVKGVSYVERLRSQRRLAFVPNDPLAVRQWYADRIRAFDAWPKLPILPRVLVAVIDSGIDADHPELEDRIATGQSFVKSPWWWDSNGHGTFVAGQIAAEMNNAQGISGLAPPADLLIAKVVRSDGTISPEAEARAIRWAVDNGAGVINLSFGGMRDPYDSGRDTYSRLEAAAVEYAVKHGVLVVAAVGNGDKAPHAPWEYANYPAALPHVIGVSAIAHDGTVPDFSNRDRVFNDIAAPGQDIFSTLPHALTQDRVGCVLQGYSECGPTQFRRGEGTSFAAPQVTAAAAILLGVRPQMRPDQVTAVLERSAADANFARGCRRCTVGRDEFTGWGVLDITAAVNSLVLPAPLADQFEPNDGAGNPRQAVGQAAAEDRSHARLLERPGRRLPREASTRAEGHRCPARPARRGDEPAALEAGHEEPARAESRLAPPGRERHRGLGQEGRPPRRQGRLVLPRGEALDPDLGPLHAFASVRRSRSSLR